MILTTKQKLVLFLISCDSDYWGIYQLVKFFDRYDFPFSSDYLEPLRDNSLIYKSKFFDNRTPSHYKVTEEGRQSLCANFDSKETIDYLKSLGEDNLLLKVVEKYLERGEPFIGAINGDE